MNGNEHTPPCKELGALQVTVRGLEDGVANRRSDDRDFKDKIFDKLDCLSADIAEVKAGRPSWAVTWILSAMATVIGILATIIIKGV